MKKIKGAKNSKSKNSNRLVNVLVTTACILTALWFISSLIYTFGTISDLFVLKDIKALNIIVSLCQGILPVATFSILFILVIALITKVETCESKISKEILLRQLEEKKNSDKIEPGDWKCSKCGKINKEYVGICGCGAEKD